MSEQPVLYELHDGIAFVTINRPEKLNALNSQTKQTLAKTFESIKRDASTHVVILTGAGDKAFVAGTDIAELTGLNSERGREFAVQGQEVFNSIEHLGKPVIAVINGFALGGGCELALACHLRIASEKASFGQPEVNLGLIPGYGGTQRLARLIGKGRALELILTAGMIDAQEALRIGLVNKVVPHAELQTSATELAKKIVEKGQIAVRLALKAVNMTDETTLTDGLSLEASLFGVCCNSEDFHEGTRAFLEKRKPLFKNK
jgi:enoyl-CoA hydratase/carnithine racemase